MYFIILLSTLLVFNLNEKLSYFANSLLLPHFLVKFPLKRLGLVEIMYVVFCLFVFQLRMANIVISQF